MPQDISGEDQWCSVRPQAANSLDGGPRKRGRVGCYTARSIGEVHTRPSESAGYYRRKRGWVQIAERYLGGHHDSSRSLDADRIGRSRRVRARTDPGADRRGARACEGEGGGSWSQTKADRPSEKGAIAR